MSEPKQENKSNSGQKQRSPSWLPDVVWAPLAAGFLMLVVGAIGLVAHQPWLFPSLGPTAFILVEKPEQPTARFYNTVVGHLIGLGTGFLAVALVGAENAPAVLSANQFTLVRVWAAVLAVALNTLGNLLLHASNPAAAATTLLIALGSFKTTWHDALVIIAGVVIIAIVGELLRGIRLGQVKLGFGK